MLLNELLAHREHFCCSRWPVRSCWLGNYTLICRQSWPIQWLIYHLRNSTNHKNKSTHCLLTLEEQEQRVLFCAGPEPGPEPRPPETTSSFSPVWWRTGDETCLSSAAVWRGHSGISILQETDHWVKQQTFCLESSRRVGHLPVSRWEGRVEQNQNILLWI